MAKIVTAGEIMLRLQPFGYKRFKQAEAYEAVFGGGEANVAVSLAQFGEDVSFITKLPNNDIADKCVMTLRGWGVDTAYIARGGERMGIYFCEKGCAQRGSKVIYDRAHSSVSEIDVSDVDISAAIEGAEWLHFTGITPALSDKATAFTRALLSAAKKNNITVSCDLNYRAKLWSREKAREVMTELMQYVDVLISNEEDCKDVFGISADGADLTGGKITADGYKVLAAELMSRFPKLSKVAFTLRESISASVNGWSAMLVTADDSFVSKKYIIDIVDRVGGGDSFAAGLIYSLISNADGDAAVNFAAAASCIKQTVEGDFNIVNVDEVNKLVGGNGSGRIVR